MSVRDPISSTYYGKIITGTSDVVLEGSTMPLWNSYAETQSAIKVDDIIQAVKKELQPERVIFACQYCGQWGALDIPCRKCGAPIK